MLIGFHCFHRRAAFFWFVALSFVGIARPQSVSTTPPLLGTLVDVGGHRIHLYCTGEGSPTVVVASGGFSFDWGLVQPEVAQWTRICTYDTAGTAWSDRIAETLPPGCENRVSELHALLQHAGIPGPYVVVGFSVGGLIARLYASRYPADLAGMVLVDHAFLDTDHAASSPLQGSRLPTGLDSPPVLISQTPIALDLEDDQNFRKLPERNQALHHWALSTASVHTTVAMAAACFSEAEAAEHQRPFPLRNMPLVVVSILYDSPHYRELQHKLLTLSQNSQQFLAENSSHMVVIDQPEIIVRAIQEVVKKVEPRSGLPK